MPVRFIGSWENCTPPFLLLFERNELLSPDMGFSLEFANLFWVGFVSTYAQLARPSREKY